MRTQTRPRPFGDDVVGDGKMGPREAGGLGQGFEFFGEPRVGDCVGNEGLGAAVERVALCDAHGRFGEIGVANEQCRIWAEDPGDLGKSGPGSVT